MGGRVLVVVLVLLVAAAACGDDDAAAPDPEGLEIWTARASTEEVVLLDTDEGSELGSVDLCCLPHDIAIGEGAVWVSTNEGTVVRIDQGTRTPEAIEVGESPGVLGVGEGAVWVSDAASRDLVRIDAETREVTHRVTIGSETEAIVDIEFGEGALWLVVEPTLGLLKVDPATLEVEERVSLCGADECRFGTATIGQGVVWVLDLEGVLYAVDPDSAEILRQGDLGSGMREIAAGDGRVWVIDEERGRLLEVDPDEFASTGAATHSFETVRTLAVTAGSVWVYDAGTGEVIRVDPETGETEAHYDVAQIAGFAVG